MNEYDPIPQETDLAPSVASTTRRPTAMQGRKPKVRRVLTKKGCRRIVATAMLVPILGWSGGLIASSGASAEQPATSAHAPGAAGGGSNARSGPAAGGSSGTVTSVSNSGFTMTTSAGQKVTVDESSSTKYKKGSSSIAASEIAVWRIVMTFPFISNPVYARVIVYCFRSPPVRQSDGAAGLPVKVMILRGFLIKLRSTCAVRGIL